MKRLIQGLAALLIVVPCLAGCGRKYNISGIVVVLDADKSTISELVRDSLPLVGKRLVGAKVTLFHELVGDRPNRQSEWKRDAVTNAQGQFAISDYAEPGTKNLVGLEVEAAGYETAYTTYYDYADPDMQYFFVVLRRKP